MKTLTFDTETTGLYNNTSVALPKQPWIVELYATVAETGEEYHQYFKPGAKMSAKAAEITGLTDDFLSDKPSFSECIDQIAAFFEQADLVAGHNIVYDINLMKFEFARCGRDFGEVLKGKRIVCTLEQTEWIFKSWPSLTQLHEYLFNEGFEGAHGAKSDVKATERCYLELVKRELV